MLSYGRQKKKKKKEKRNKERNKKTTENCIFILVSRKTAGDIP